MSDYALVSLNGAVVNDLLRKYKDNRDMMESESLNRFATELQDLLDKAKARLERNKSTGLDKNALLAR